MERMCEVKETSQLATIEGMGVLSFKLKNDNEEKLHALFRIIMENATLQRYYWVSRFDETYIEYIDPIVYDAFYVVIDAVGTVEQLKTIRKEFSEYVKGIKTAEKMFS